jgi:hypothetical protein
MTELVPPISNSFITDVLWGEKEDGQFFMLGSGVSTRNDGRQMNACSVVSKPQDADDVAKIFKARLKLNLLVDEVEGYTIFIWCLRCTRAR